MNNEVDLVEEPKIHSRTPVPASIAVDDSPGHPAIPQHPQNFHLHQVRTVVVHLFVVIWIPYLWCVWWFLWCIPIRWLVVNLTCIQYLGQRWKSGGAHNCHPSICVPGGFYIRGRSITAVWIKVAICSPIKKSTMIDRWSFWLSTNCFQFHFSNSFVFTFTFKFTFN